MFSTFLKFNLISTLLCCALGLFFALHTPLHTLPRGRDFIQLQEIYSCDYKMLCKDKGRKDLLYRIHIFSKALLLGLHQIIA
jgi:hypothetical protein